MRLKRKIDSYLMEWKDSDLKKTLIVKGSRQIGKTDAIRNFGQKTIKAIIKNKDKTIRKWNLIKVHLSIVLFFCIHILKDKYWRYKSHREKIQ